jgi:hypothetical protein
VESVQSTAGSRDVRISVSNAGYTKFRGRVRVLATHSISQFLLHFPSRASPCAIRVQTSYTYTVLYVFKAWCLIKYRQNIIYTLHKVSDIEPVPVLRKKGGDTPIQSGLTISQSLSQDPNWNTHIAHLRQQCHKSKLVIFQEKRLKILKCYTFLWVQRRHNCSPAASFTICFMTLYMLKVHLQMFLSTPITQKCQILSCDTLVANERYFRPFTWG